MTIPNEQEREIGYITGWRISKPTGVNPNIDIMPFGEDWYWSYLNTFDDQSIQMVYCFRALWGDPDMFVRPNSMIDTPRKVSRQVVDEEKKVQLRGTGNEIIYIQTIYVKWREDLSDEKTEVRNRIPALSSCDTDLRQFSIVEMASADCSYNTTTDCWVARYYLLGTRSMDR